MLLAEEPLVESLTEVLNRLDWKPTPSWTCRARRPSGARWYFGVMEERWFSIVLIPVFVVVAAVTLVQVAFGARQIINGDQHLHVISFAGLASSLVASALIVIGLVPLRESRIAAMSSRRLPRRRP
jgi:hypothetical protein